MEVRLLAGEMLARTYADLGHKGVSSGRAVTLMKLVNKKVACPVIIRESLRIGVEVKDLIAFSRIRRPWRQARAVRVSGLCKIAPIRAHQIRDLFVLRPPGEVSRREHFKDKFNFGCVGCRRLDIRR
jgi:hypothetical protein